MATVGSGGCHYVDALAHIPKGDYPATAAVHLLDLESAADRLAASCPDRRQTETLAREAGTSVVMMAMEAGDAIKEHSAKSPVSVQLLRGHVALNAGGQGSGAAPRPARLHAAERPPRRKRARKIRDPADPRRGLANRKLTDLQ